jgi:hypothetical protein
VSRVALLYVALTVLLAYPLPLDPARRVMSPTPDTDLYMWTLAWDVHAIAHQPLSIFDANIYYPERRTLAYSENLIGSALVAAPVLWLTRNMVLAMNLVALASCVLCGLGAYVLARRVGVGPAGATLGGIVFAFSPPRFLRLDQLHLATIQWVPFSLAYLHAYLDGGRPRDLRLAIAFLTLQALTSGHGMVFLVVAFVLLLVHRIVVARAWRPAVGGLFAFARDIGVPGALLIAPTVLMFVPYVIVQREVGLRRSLENWAVSWSSFLASPSHVHALMLSLVPGNRINQTADAYLFPGLLPLLLAIVAVAPPRRPHPLHRRDATTFYALLTVASIWLAMGPPIGLWPLVYWLPGLNLIRVPSRFTLLAVLGIAVLAGQGFDRLRRGRLSAAIVGALLVAEFAAMPLGTEPYAVEIPAIDRWLATRPGSFAIAEVPLPNPANLGSWERRETAFMLHSTAHWQKTVHGYSGFRTPLHEQLYAELTNFPDEKGLHHLAQLGVGYVVVHTDLYRPGEWTEVERRISGVQPLLTLERVEGMGRVYAIRTP